MTVYADSFVPFFGTVESNADPLKQGRVQVRVIGYHTANPSQIPTEQLPWFSSVVSNSVGVNGYGNSPTGYAVGSTVFGYFVDRTFQRGIVVGSLVGSTNGANDISGLAVQNPNHPLYNLRERNAINKIQETDPNTTWSELPYVNNSKYPDNEVYESQGGLIREMDGTPGQERIDEYHPSGTYYEVRPDGTRTVKVVGDGYEIIAGSKFVDIKGTVNITMEGNCNQFIKGDWNVQVSGNKKEIVMGDVTEYYATETKQVTSDITINAGTVTTNANSVDTNLSDPSFVDVPVTVPVEYNVEFVRASLTDSGRNQEFDEQDTIHYTPPSYPQDVPPPTYTGTAKQDANVPQKPTTTPKIDDCIKIELPLDYNTRLSENYTIANFSTGALFSHQIQAQRGLTIPQIVCNMQALATHIAEPIRKQFGPFRINSGFRPGNMKSNHNIGCAIDIQDPSWSNDKLWEVAQWVAKNLVYEECLFELGNNYWLHVSFRPDKAKQRGYVATMHGGHWELGLKNYL